MTDINETIAEVLRLEAAASGRKVWEARMVCPRGGWSDDDAEFIDIDGWWLDGPEWLDYDDASFFHQADAALIAYYRTAAPALAREVQRLQGEVRQAQTGHDCALVAAYESGLRAGQEAMRERAAALCRARADRYAAQVEQREPGSGGRIVADARSAEAEACANAIRALEVSHAE